MDKVARRPSFDQICNALVKEPFNLPLSEIPALTPYQVKYIYFREKDDDEYPSAPNMPPSTTSHKPGR